MVLPLAMDPASLLRIGVEQSPRCCLQLIVLRPEDPADRPARLVDRIPLGQPPEPIMYDLMAVTALVVDAAYDHERLDRMRTLMRARACVSRRRRNQRAYTSVWRTSMIGINVSHRIRTDNLSARWPGAICCALQYTMRIFVTGSSRGGAP